MDSCSKYDSSHKSSRLGDLCEILMLIWKWSWEEYEETRYWKMGVFLIWCGLCQIWGSKYHLGLKRPCWVGGEKGFFYILWVISCCTCQGYKPQSGSLALGTGQENSTAVSYFVRDIAELNFISCIAQFHARDETMLRQTVLKSHANGSATLFCLWHYRSHHKNAAPQEPRGRLWHGRSTWKVLCWCSCFAAGRGCGRSIAGLVACIAVIILLFN